MSYRSFKHLLGETSLERKCRFIFGGGILVLVTASFYWYGQKTESLVINQTTQAARMLVNPTLMNIHYKATGNSEFQQLISMLWDDLSLLDDLPKYDARILNPYKSREKDRPVNDFERTTLARFVRSANSEEAFRKAGNPRNDSTFGDGTKMWDFKIPPGKKDFQYLQAVLYKPGCLIACHGSRESDIDNHMSRQTPDGKYLMAKAGDFAGMVSIGCR